MFSKSDVRRWSRRQIAGQGKPLPLAGRLALLAGLLLFVGLAVFNARAQDAPALKCDVALMQSFQQSIDEQNKAISDAAAAGDVGKWLSLILQSRLAYGIIDSNCRGMEFSSDKDGKQPVIGPVIFQDGIWKATFTTTNYGIVGFTEVAGDCDKYKTGGLFNLTDGQATEGVQAAFTTSGICTAMIEVSNTQSDWKLSFELVAPAAQ